MTVAMMKQNLRDKASPIMTTGQFIRFGKLLSIIQTQEAADAFAQLNLTPLYEALKQLPEIATMITKYYPSGMTSIEGALGLLGGLTPEVAVEWSVDYELAQ